MINYGVINTLNLLAFLGILAVCVGKGGRYERGFAGMLFAAWLVVTLAQKLSHDAVPLSGVLTADLALLAGLGWILWRYRPPWMVAATAFQLIMVAFDAAHLLPLPSTDLLFLTVGNSLSYLQCACLLFGVVRLRVGPPFRLPAVEQAEPRRHARAA